MRTAIKEYLEKQIKNDTALSEKYDPEKMDKCSEYITDLAKKQLGGKPGYIEDATVYKWARDFFLEGPADEGKEECGTEEKVTGNADQLSFDFGG
jgi:hypothetical protein